MTFAVRPLVVVCVTAVSLVCLCAAGSYAASTVPGVDAELSRLVLAMSPAERRQWETVDAWSYGWDHAESRGEAVEATPRRRVLPRLQQLEKNGALQAPVAPGQYAAPSQPPAGWVSIPPQGPLKRNNMGGATIQDQPCEVLKLHPAQYAVGKNQVAKQVVNFEKQLRDGNFTNQRTLPVVRGPGNLLYVIDGHHHASSLARVKVHWLVCEVKADWSAKPPAKFWADMVSHGYAYLKDNHFQPIPYTRIPKTILDVADNPWRTAADVVGKAGHYKEPDDKKVPFCEFFWGEFMKRSGVSEFSTSVEMRALLSADKEDTLKRLGGVVARTSAAARQRLCGVLPLSPAEQQAADQQLAELRKRASKAAVPATRRAPATPKRAQAARRAPTTTTGIAKRRAAPRTVNAVPRT